MFQFNSKNNQFEQEINNIIFVTDELFENCEQISQDIALIYESRLPAIAQFLLDEDIEAFIGPSEVQMIIAGLGRPIIDISKCLISYCENTLDYSHIIDVEFDGILSRFDYMGFDG
ncbi:TPA: hypothetical protein ACGPA6_000059 [Streptococcus suis]